MSNAMRWILLSTLLAAGCGNDQTCAGDDECFAGEVCIAEVCQRPGETAENATTPNNASVNSNGTANSSTTPNVATNVATNAANSSNTARNASSGVCRGDTFESCPVDTDEDFREYLNGEGGHGCNAPDDNFEGGVVVAADRTICPLENSDRYDTTVVPCRSTAFFVDVLVAPQQACLAEDWSFEVSLSGNSCAEPNGLVDCEDMPDGSKRATLIVEPDSSVLSLYTTIEPIAEGARFDYDLTIEFRQ